MESFIHNLLEEKIPEYRSHKRNCNCTSCFEKRKKESEVSLFPLSPEFFQIVINKKFYNPPKEVNVLNFFASSIHRFKRVKKRNNVNELVIHETVSTNVQKTVDVLKNRKTKRGKLGYGIHFIVGHDGKVTQHGDLLQDYFYHANQHSGPSVGIEVLNPVKPSKLTGKMPWKRVIKAGWVREGRYVVPLLEQAETVTKLIRWLTNLKLPGFDIPRHWIGQTNSGKLAMNRYSKARRKNPGIYAHTYFNHSDGAWLILYSYLRLELGYSPSAAYEKAITLGENANRGREKEDWKGWWVKLPKKINNTQPSNHNCTPMDEILGEVFPDHLSQCNHNSNYIKSYPTPGAYYQIQSGDTLVGVAARAYGPNNCKNSWACSRKINNHSYNQQFWLRSLASSAFKEGRISFSPRFRGIVELPTAKRYQALRGREFAVLWIPK